MGKHKKLTGVAHDIAHHSASGLSYINPHLAVALRAVGMESTEIDLLSPFPYPPIASESKPLRLALAGLHDFLVTLLQKYGFSTEEVSRVILHVSPVVSDKQGYLVHTRTVITSSEGRIYDSGWIL